MKKRIWLQTDKEELMHKKDIYKIAYNRQIADRTYMMRLSGSTEDIKAPGQFINIALPGFYLRRPISVCDWDKEGIDIIYKVVGEGTELMASLEPGFELDILTGLGNGFDTSALGTGGTALLIGGGVGVPPLYGLAKRLVKKGIAIAALLGFNESSQLFFEDEFRALGAAVHITTADGSAGIKGFVTDALPDIHFDYYYCCGPMPMLRAVHRYCTERGIEGELSFEARMGCGFGACMGCSMETLSGPKRICKDGPVFRSGEVSFGD